MTDFMTYYNEMEGSSSKYTLVESSGISRIWQYTQGDMEFAIIGSQDQDTKEDHNRELAYDIKHIPGITYRTLRGNYKYDDGSTGSETSYLVNNITKDKALRLGKKYNQESIIWHDKNFFGFINCNTGEEDNCFSRSKKNLSFDPDAVAAYGSSIDSKHNKGQGFTFVAEELMITDNYSSIRHFNKNYLNVSTVPLFKMIIKG